MNTIKIEEEYSKYKFYSEKEENYMNKREITPEITSEQLFELAKTAVDYANRDDEFIVRDLFREIEWRHIPEEIRMKAGELFGNYAESEEG